MNVLKWAGNKSRMAGQIRSIMGSGYTGWCEPFMGGCGFTMSHREGLLRLNDRNADLVNIMVAIRDDTERFVHMGKQFFDDPGDYYLRRSFFNQTVLPLSKAALFLYLNRHGFNGLCRYNSKGEFNVPKGRHKSIVFPEEAIRKLSVLLQGSVILNQDFEAVMDDTGEGWAIYCDPPYLPVSSTSSFVDYSTGGFSLEDQKRLHRAAIRASQRSATVAISNSHVPLALDTFQSTETHTLEASRSISARGEGRGRVKEYLFVYRP